MSDSDQSEESLYSDSDKDLGNASDIPILSEESEIEDDSGDNIAISNPQYIPSWMKDLSMYGVAEIEFSGDSGASDEVKSSDPLYLFELIFTEKLCESIADMTNLYAERFIAKNKGNLSSHVKKWKNVTSTEMKLFLGFILYQGMIWKPTYEHYFTINSIFSTPGVMLLIMKNLEKSILWQLKSNQYGITVMRSFNPFTPLGNTYQLTNHYYFGKADYQGHKAYWQNLLTLVSKCTW